MTDKSATEVPTLLTGKYEREREREFITKTLACMLVYEMAQPRPLFFFN